MGGLLWISVGDSKSREGASKLKEGEGSGERDASGLLKVGVASCESVGVVSPAVNRAMDGSFAEEVCPSSCDLLLLCCANMSCGVLGSVGVSLVGVSLVGVSLVGVVTPWGSMSLLVGSCDEGELLREEERSEVESCCGTAKRLEELVFGVICVVKWESCSNSLGATREV